MAKPATSIFPPITLIAAFLCSLCLAQPSLAASIRGWGSQAIDSTEPGQKDFIAVSAGQCHSLALECVCWYVVAGHLNDDCEVDFDDFVLMGANWLIDCHIEPPNLTCVPK